jgi:hypothetical protein
MIHTFQNLPRLNCKKMYLLPTEVLDKSVLHGLDRVFTLTNKQRVISRLGHITQRMAKNNH